MATKLRTSKKTSNDKQKKLLALVLIILFIGLGVFLVVSSFAAKGGKGKPGSITLVDSPYGITASPNTFKYPGATLISAIDKNTGALLNPQPENMIVKGPCYSNGVYLGEFNKLLTNGQVTLNITASSFANGATCTEYLYIGRNGALVPTAVTTFTITP